MPLRPRPRRIGWRARSAPRGYLNVLDAALAAHAAAGHGRVLGVTSGSGGGLPMPARTSCAKRAVAALPAAGPASAAGGDRQRDVAHRGHPNGRRCHRARSSGGTTEAAAGSPFLNRCQAPSTLGRSVRTSSGRIRVVHRPGSLRWRLGGGGDRRAPPARGGAQRGRVSLAGVLRAVILAPSPGAEANQASDGGGNPRFGQIFDESAFAEPASAHVDPVPSSPTARSWQRLSPPRSSPSVTCHRVEAVHASGMPWTR